MDWLLFIAVGWVARIGSDQQGQCDQRGCDGDHGDSFRWRRAQRQSRRSAEFGV